MSEGTAAGVVRGYLSDNAAGAAPEIAAAMTEAAVGLASPYASDDLSTRVGARMAEVFEHPVDVFPVGTGSAANGIALAALTPPWGSILSHPDGHIANDEAGAPKALQRMLGHASAAMTLDVYSDLFDDDLDAVAKRPDEARAESIVVKSVVKSRL